MCAILSHNNLHCTEITTPIARGEGVETHAIIIINLPVLSLHIYNTRTYRSAGTRLDLGKLLTFASTEPILIEGDFKARHPFFQPPQPFNAAGRHVLRALKDIGGVSLPNDVSHPTHIRNGRIDFTIVSTRLVPVSILSLHTTLTSDHFGIPTRLHVEALLPPS